MDISTFTDPSSPLFKLVIALFLGAFVGLRREIDIQKEGSESFVGFRTLPLIVLLGAISTLFPPLPYLPAICLIGVLVFLAIAYYNGVFKLKLIGLTSEFATLLMFIVGILVGYGEFIIAIVLTVMTALLTGFKAQFHKFAKNISPKEWGGALQLLILSAVVLPFLPREAVDPWGVLIPFDIWLLVIFVSGIGFVGYFFNKYLGSKKSMMATSVLGSLVSSTAVTIALGFQAKKHPKLHKRVFILAMLVSIATMLVRTIVAIFVIATPATNGVLLVPVSMLAAAILLVLWYAKFTDQEDAEVIDIEPEITSPFDLVPALKFTGLFVFVLLAVHFGKEWLGTGGVLVVSALSAFVDVDATILSSLQSEKTGELAAYVAMLAITIAIVVNTLVKSLYLFFLSRRDVATSISFITGVLGIIGFATFFLIT